MKSRYRASAGAIPTAETPQPRPWHRIVRLKEELRSGALSLAEFAADLHEVTLGQGRRPVYEEPEKCFALTCPTHALRELARDVAGRLAGQSDKAVRQLELTYGGGRTHTLITLYHLSRDPEALPDLPAVREFREHVGAGLPRALVATLCFDKIDDVRGMRERGAMETGTGIRTRRRAGRPGPGGTRRSREGRALRMGDRAPRSRCAGCWTTSAVATWRASRGRGTRTRSPSRAAPGPPSWTRCNAGSGGERGGSPTAPPR